MAPATRGRPLPLAQGGAADGSIRRLPQAPANADGSVHDTKPDEAPEVTFVDEETFWATF